MKESFIKKAPYTVLIIVFICLFWGLKALSASGQIKVPFFGDESAGMYEEAGNSTDENKVPESKTDSIAFIPATLGEASPAEESNDSGEGTADDAGIETPDNGGSSEPGENDNNGGGSEPGANDNNGLGNAGGEADSEANEKSEGCVGHGNIDNPDLLNSYPYSFGDIEGNCVTYTPAEIDSRYYKDCGKIALDTVADYVKVEDDYFDDACFVGDSRMVGIFDYAGWDKADFYCDNGYCIYNYMGGKNVICQNNNKKYKLEDAIKRKKYGKVYIMMGTNDCGYGTTESFKESYSEMLEMIKTQLPDAVIFVVSNMRISKDAEKNDKTGVYKNLNINDKNTAIAELADGERVFYFDINAPFVDKEGYLIDEYTFDGFHVYAKQYTEMADIFKAHGIKN
ncbi:MAG: hypothetical protein IJ691_01255 [Lachnospiraceae bacterium]|nr:hypothetical protein [Lachnospiraceae bacterium]